MPAPAPKPVVQTRASVEADIMAQNERLRLERALGRLTGEIDQLEQDLDRRRPRNRRYNVDFSFLFEEFTPPDSENPLYVETRGVSVNQGTRFYAMAIEQHYAIQSRGATFNLGPIAMRQFFDFEWQVRDTGTDREWQNDWLPSDFLYSGDKNGLLVPENPALVSGGSNIDVTLKVIFSTNSGEGTLFEDIERHLLQVSFVGIEVPE